MTGDMDRLARVYALKSRRDAILAEHVPEPSRLLLTEKAGPHIEAAFANRMKSRVTAEYHWAYADSYISFVEDEQRQRAAMIEEGQLCLAD
jgi:hypothetical protein